MLTLINVPYASKYQLSFIQRSAADQSVMSSKFEVLGGELDEKRKLIEHGSVSSFFVFIWYCFVYKVVNRNTMIRCSFL